MWSLVLAFAIAQAPAPPAAPTQPPERRWRSLDDERPLTDEEARERDQRRGMSRRPGAQGGRLPPVSTPCEAPLPRVEVSAHIDKSRETAPLFDAVARCFPGIVVPPAPGETADFLLTVTAWHMDKEWSGSVTLVELDWGRTLIVEVLSPRRGALFVEAFAAAIARAANVAAERRAKLPALRRADARRRDVLSRVTLVLDANTVFQPEEQIAFDVLLARLRRHGVRVRAFTDARDEVEKLSDHRAYLLVADVVLTEVPSDSFRLGGMKRYDIEGRWRLLDGDRVVARDVWSVGALGINPEIAARERFARRSGTQGGSLAWEEHADRLVAAIVRDIGADVPALPAE